MLAVARILQAAVDKPLPGGLKRVGCGHVGQEGIDLCGRRRQAEHVEGEPADQRLGRRLGRRLDARLTKPGQHKPIDLAGRPAVVGQLGWGNWLEWSKGPPAAILIADRQARSTQRGGRLRPDRTALHPGRQGSHFISGQRSVWWHLEAIPTNRRNQQARLRIARLEHGSAVAPGCQASLSVEPQASLLFFATMAADAPPR